MELTAGQINSFNIMALKKLVYKGDRSVDLANIGDKTFNEQKNLVNLLHAMLTVTANYDPDAESNCLTYEQILGLIEFIDLKLEVAANFDNLPETPLS